MEKKYIIYIAGGVVLGMVLGFFVGVYYKNEKAQNIKRNFFNKELTLDGYGVLPKYFINAQVDSVTKDSLEVSVGPIGLAKNSPTLKRNKIKINIADSSQIFLKRLKTQEEIYGQELYKKIQVLETKLKEKGAMVSDIHEQIASLKKQSYKEISEETKRIVAQATTTGNVNDQKEVIRQKIVALNGGYIFQPLALSDLKANDKVKIYSNEDVDNPRVINALRIEVTR